MKRILVVDDDDNVRSVLVRCLKILGEGDYDVVGAGDGNAGLTEIARQRPDLVLLDLLMPGMSGIEVLQEARGLHGDLTVIVISGYADEELARTALRSGAADFFLKPFRLNTVREQVRRRLALDELGRRLAS